MQRITLKRLPLENLKRKPLRTIALIVVAACLSAVFFGGALISMNLSRGLKSMRERLGADIMVVPQGTNTKAEALLTNGGSSTFYFTNNIEDLVKRAPGVKKVSVQTYISSLSAGCCAEKLQIIGFDPSTDFVIGPWIYSQHSSVLRAGDMIAGANVSVSYDNTVRLYGHKWNVVSQLAKTGTSLDNSVFVNRQTVPQVIEYSAKVGHIAIPKEYATKAISAVLVKVDKSYSPQKVADNIRKTSGLSSIGIIFPGGITATTKENLSIVTRSITVVVAILWLISIIVMVTVFASSIGERKKECASLRIIGVNRISLVKIIVKESCIIGLAGGVIGVAFASLILFPYNSLISKQLQLPYLEITAIPVVILIIVGILVSLITTLLTSIVVTRNIAVGEAYLKLREGE